MLQSSRNSLGETLRDVNAAIDAGQASSIGDSLLGIVSVLAENAQLRRVAADSATSPEQKRGLLTALLSGRVDAAALEVTIGAAGRHWARAQDFVTAIEVAGVTAVAADAQSAGQLGQVEEELFRFTRLIEADHELGWAFGSAAAPESKRSLVSDLLGGRATAFTVKLAEQAAAHSRGLRVSETLNNYSSVLAARQQRSVADVVVAQPLTPQQQERLARALSASYGRELVLNVQVDPDVIGGVRVQVGDEVINSTIAERLADARRQLAG
jgi:F-type H+-transporting ATPase subunit delta